MVIMCIKKPGVSLRTTETLGIFPVARKYGNDKMERKRTRGRSLSAAYSG